LYPSAKEVQTIAEIEGYIRENEAALWQTNTQRA
jgi:hypothetical protein